MAIILLIIVHIVQFIQLFIVIVKPWSHLLSRRRLYWKAVSIVVMFTLVAIYLSLFESGEIDCCTNTRAFNPDHFTTVLVWITIGFLSYATSTLRIRLFPPLLEVLVNVGLIAGFILNIFIAIQIEDLFIFGNVFVALALLTEIIESQVRLNHKLEKYNTESSSLTGIGLKILYLASISRFGVFILLMAPLFTVVTSVLLLFGQQANSIILAFTQTYHRFFSELDDQCLNVDCGGHYLCSVAANGTVELVKPQRLGFRNGAPIKCNRQLLISNAFEEVIQDRLPRLHGWIRKHYDKVGDQVHRNYRLFEKKSVSNAVYILMKPLEWSFLIFLYLTTRHPEDRIQLQYLHQEEREDLMSKVNR